MYKKWLISLFAALCLLAGCGQRAVAASLVEVPDTPVPLASMPEASGQKVEKSNKAEIDYSNTKDGYIMVRFTANTSKRLKVQVEGPRTTYTYDLPAGSWTTFPLSDGNGNYKATVLENASGNKYAVLLSASFKVALSSEFAPFLRPNQYVNYASGAKNTLNKAAELTAGVADPLLKVEKIYNYVVGALSYDTEKAASVKSGYLPSLDKVLASGKGICFDYAALAAGMLRSQGVPCKLAVGYAGSEYHAWIHVWSEKSGWVNGVIQFNGSTWKRMDPTFASSSNNSQAMLDYIANGSNYSVKYLY